MCVCSLVLTTALPCTIRSEVLELLTLKLCNYAVIITITSTSHLHVCIVECTMKCVAFTTVLI